MIPFFESAALLTSALVVVTILGFGPVLSCLPNFVRPYAFFVAPAIGYVLFCFFSIWGSALANIPLLHSNWFAFFGLTLWSTIACFFYREELPDILHMGKWVVVLLLLMFMVVFFPALHQGVDLYLGTVNPDFYQSLSFHEVLVQFDAPFWVKAGDLPLQGPFLESFPTALQARFGGVAFSVFLEQLFGLSSRSALMLSIMVFLSCLPLAVYFFSRFVLEFEHKTALLSALLLILAAPITMSFLYSLVGQNSVLSVLPFTLSLAYLAFQERSLKLLALVVLILNGVFWLYVMVLPYILVPFGIFALVASLNQGWRQVKWLFFALFCTVVISLTIHYSMLHITIRFMKDLFDLLSNVKASMLDLKFLTEEVFSYATGLTSYPLSQSLLFRHVAFMASVGLFLMGITLAALYFVSLRLWARTAPRNAIILVVCLLVTYIAVWVKYTFITRYGYASFKMISWLQFLVVPFFAWGIVFYARKIRELKLRNQKLIGVYGVLGFFILGYLGLNLVSDIDYMMKSYGHDRYHGSIINAYNVSNNIDYLVLAKELKNRIPPGSTVATGFGDSIQNFWAAYYIDRAGLKARILSHEEIPLEDAYLPDMISRTYYDFLGNLQIAVQKFFYSGKADFYLLPASDNMNKDIVNSTLSAKPIWSNKTFALYQKKDVKDLVVTGRGYNRVEYMNRTGLSYWWPSVFRWSAEGGELFHLFPLSVKQPYQIQLSAISGLGLPAGRRTLEFWHNEKKFDEIVVSGAARVTTRPYYPVSGVNRLLIRIKEPAVLPPYHFGLWNRDLPLASRQISLLFSDMKIKKESDLEPLHWKLGERVEPKQMFALVDGFNGFDVDGWVRDKAEITLEPPLSAKAVRLKFLVPGNLGFDFPYKVKLVLNGVLHETDFVTPGDHEVLLDIPQSASRSFLKLEIFPDQVKRLAEGIEQREVLQSIRLSNVEFL